MRPTWLLPALLFLAACSSSHSGSSGPEPDPQPTSAPAPSEESTVTELTLRPGETTELGGLTLSLVPGRRITRRDGSHLNIYSLAYGGELDLEGDSERFVDEARAGETLITALGWKDGALVLRLGPAPDSDPLDEHAAGELGEDAAREHGLEPDDHDAGYQLTRGEGAVLFTLEDGAQVRFRVVIGLHSGQVIQGP